MGIHIIAIVESHLHLNDNLSEILGHFLDYNTRTQYGGYTFSKSLNIL
jgi:hypothetical protein